MDKNAYRGAVQIELDKPRTLRIDFNAMIEAEDILGQPFDLTKIFDLGARGLRALLYVGLKKEDPALTIEQVGELAFLCDQGKVMEAVMASVWGGKIPEEVKKRAEEHAKNALTLARTARVDGESETVSAVLQESA